ncbi:50S ribosomal protein L29 [Candidatus Woesearchaeota archaeon CG10_big_fil_rev_8_21_14_0_10_45_16]|nr:MAG: 50S ribosomal protein L29 [Candidatus Woesearchaeota archaeon CG10_big_fil_rev_8_21_14_0_10_45_16]
MKITKELRGLSDVQLKGRAEEFKKELLKLNAQVASGANTANPGKLRQMKKNIARIYTLLQEKEVPSK